MVNGNKVAFQILGEPQGKGRPRFTNRGPYVKTYTPDKTASYENLVKLEYERQCGRFRFDDKESLCMKIIAYHSIPKSTSNKRKNMMLSGQIRPIKKPDMDNIAKIIADSLNDVAYKDDTQVVDCVIKKMYGAIPRVVVIIEKSK